MPTPRLQADGVARRIRHHWSQCSAVERVPKKGGGEWLFKHRRVPVRALFENLEGGARIDEFLEWYPGVTREQV